MPPPKSREVELTIESQSFLFRRLAANGIARPVVSVASCPFHSNRDDNESNVIFQSRTDRVTVFCQSLATVWLMVVLTLAGSGCSQSKTDTVEQDDQSDTADTSFARHIDLEGQSNFRDVGGYQTSDGHTVKVGQVFRSGELHRLSDEDVKRLEGLEIKTVVNFLTEPEIASRGEDRLPDGVKLTLLPMKTGNLEDLAEVVTIARKTGDFSKVPPDLNPGIHRILMDQGREYYAKLLRQIADPANRPLVFHCSHGVHRTGTATAILLSALGVPWETIREDYLLSNELRKEDMDRRIEELKKLDSLNRGIPLDEVDTTNIEAFYVLQGEYIDAALNAAVDEYGSMDAFIRDGLGLSDEEIAKLRDELLEEAGSDEQ